MVDRSLSEARDRLLEREDLVGTTFCRALSDEMDRELSRIAEAASGGGRRLALIAVGGYGRRELCPFSDLDLVLVHDARRDIKEVADALWYPLWDQGIKIDHAVRRPKELVKVAKGDLRVALGLLDARVVWGDPRVASGAIDKVRSLWTAKLAAAFLPALEEQMEERHRAEGDVAFLLEPNLKEAHGGLRDVNVLQALGTCAPRLGELVDLDSLARSAATLLAVRVELHRGAGRALDRMLLQEQDQVARRLAYDDADALCAAVSEAGRSIARLSDETWRRRPLWAPGQIEPAPPASARTVIEDGIALGGGEVLLTAAADVTGDPSLVWRIAAVSAERDVPIALGAVHRLAEHSPAPPTPWSPELRGSLVRLLASGHAAIAPFEALDQQGLVERQLPEWTHVRHLHQRNAYHRFTVDRHLLETAANAADLADGVDRPDLLVLAALLHDIGKGLPGDHTIEGLAILAALGPRLGLDEADVDTLARLLANHLLLADTATRRDLADPTTIETVATAVADPQTLALLERLTKADSLATGPSAWGSWKEQLVAELVERVDAALRGSPTLEDHVLDASMADLLAQATTSNVPLVRLEPPTLVVAAADRPRLLAEVTGVLALHGLDVRSADVTGADGIALDTFQVDAPHGRWPTAADIEVDLAAVAAGTLDLAAQLDARAASYAGQAGPKAARPVLPSVRIDEAASKAATVLEVRARDRIGLLHELTRTLADARLDVIAARVATVGQEVVDAFYVVPHDGDDAAPDVTDALRALEGVIGA
jgi:[protein-PII] uridylyltransferase